MQRAAGRAVVGPVCSWTMNMLAWEAEKLIPVSTSVTSQIEVDDRGVAWITGAKTKVTEVVLDKIAHGWSPEEMHLQHPHLSLAQIHSALAYYYEFKETIDDQIEREVREADELTAEASDPVFRKKLLALKNTR
jgi:uncharacterized protein (DUF433 family)